MHSAVLTYINSCGMTCWAVSHLLNMNEQRYENRIPEGQYSSKHSTRLPMAGSGIREGILKIGTSINKSVHGIRKRMASARKN